MPIEFNCTQCSQLLRVPDNSAGKSARCPKCQALMVVPAAAGTAPAGPPASISQPLPSSSFADAPAAGNPFASSSQGANPFAGSAPPPKPPENPFADKSAPNPYASPTGGLETQVAYPGGPITNVRVGLEQILNHSFRVWQANLGVLVGATLILLVITYAIALPLQFFQELLQRQREFEMALAVGLIGNIISNLVQTFLGIGMAQIALKVSRGMPATVGDLFGGGPKFLPVLGASILAGIAFFLGFMLCIVPGVLLALWFWPFYYLIVDEKTGVFESFSLAATITEGNRLTTLLMWIVSFGIVLLGLLALCVGVIFAAPLVSVMTATAYLMMSGQLPLQPQYGKY